MIEVRSKGVKTGDGSVSWSKLQVASVQGELNKTQLIDFGQLTELFFDTFLNFVEDYKIA